MRPFILRTILPTLLAILPALAGVLIFAALPPDARHDYVERVEHSPFDQIILALGLAMFIVQTMLAWTALRWAAIDFDTRPDKWLNHLAQAAEWFPLLGLIGTVAAILQTFGSFTPGTTPTPQEIIRKYAPAITATGSGLFMALLNILPAWIVAAGRDLIRSLLGESSPMVPLTPANEARPPL